MHTGFHALGPGDLFCALHFQVEYNINVGIHLRSSFHTLHRMRPRWQEGKDITGQLLFIKNQNFWAALYGIYTPEIFSAKSSLATLKSTW